MKLIAILTLFCCSIAFANADVKAKATASVVDAKKIDSLVLSYLLNKNQQKSNLFESLSSSRRPPHCDPHNPPNSSECLDVVCDKLGTYGCDTQSEISQVTLACRGVDSDCVSASCSYLGTYGCDTISEIQQVTNTCRDVFDGRCMEVACNKLGTYGCDTMSEIQQVGALCKGRVDNDCIESVCQRLGTYGCDTMSELQQVARSCGGN